MKIVAVDAFPIRLDRDPAKTIGTAGSPTKLAATEFDYRWSETYPALYSIHFETALVRIETEEGLTGWGEAQAPLAPEVACTIVRTLLRPVLIGQKFKASREDIERLWMTMYSTMRVRGQTGGFMLDAISGVDLALWDLAGKSRGESVARLLRGDDVRQKLPAYLSGLRGERNKDRVISAEGYWEQGFRVFKLFHDRTTEELFDLIDRLRAKFGGYIRIAVDALWRLGDEDMIEFGKALDDRAALWLECPLLPEHVGTHERLAKSIKTPLAIGESYRTHFEIEPFLKRKVIGWLQPDLGRSGITESLRWAERARNSAVSLVPHVSIALGPQIAAALQLAAATPECPLVEYNPRVLEVANHFLQEPLSLDGAAYQLPERPGLGIRLLESDVLISEEAQTSSG
ncbi:MAG: mandelate racemase/muconate lactonizing enzyme family protein [Proteobacteria bacterium]|nr:mandelate racemase/muconate lactonizing enzyme family protein [Pseudomonadota bacterium]